MRRIVPALLLVLAVGAPGRADPRAPLAARSKPGAPSTSVVPPYPGMTLVVGSRPGTGGSGIGRSPSLERFETYVTADGYDQVVRFYQAKLGLSPTAAHPKNLAATFPGQAIPFRSQGRRSVFRVAPSASTVAGQTVEQRILGHALGGTNVVVSDFSVDPVTHQIVDQTSIILLVYR